MKFMLLNFKSIWASFWTPTINSDALPLFRIWIFTFAMFFFDFPGAERSLHHLEQWAPVGIFKIFPGPVSPKVFSTLSIVWLFAGSLAILGAFYRVTGPVAALSLVYCQAYEFNFGSVSHSIQLFSFALLLVGFAPSHRSFSFDSIIFPSVTAQRDWIDGAVLRTVMFQSVWVLFINGFLKIYRSGIAWIFSDNLLFQTFYTINRPEFADWLLKNFPSFFAFGAAFVVVLQITSFLPLVYKKLALTYVLLWSTFHFGTTILLGGHERFWSHIAVYFSFIFFWHSEPISLRIRAFGRRLLLLFKERMSPI